METIGPFFDDLRVGQQLEPASPITVTEGMAAMYQAIVGDPYPLGLSAALSRRVSGVVLANPALALHVSIGQSTVATRQVIANLFYRGVRLTRPVAIGETLATVVTINGLRENTRRPDRPARGMALLGIVTTTDEGDEIARYERCALLPLRRTDDTGNHHDLGPSTQPLDLAAYESGVPFDWDLAPLPAAAAWNVGETKHDYMRDTVTDAIALARLTQNQAAVHRDARRGQHGQRLVYGGHTAGLAQASLCRLLPSIAHVIGWQHCDHVGPVFEDDVLSFAATLIEQRAVGNGRLIAFSVQVHAERADQTHHVLDWMPIVYSK